MAKKEQEVVELDQETSEYLDKLEPEDREKFVNAAVLEYRRATEEGGLPSDHWLNQIIELDSQIAELHEKKETAINYFIEYDKGIATKIERQESALEDIQKRDHKRMTPASAVDHWFGDSEFMQKAEKGEPVRDMDIRKEMKVVYADLKPVDWQKGVPGLTEIKAYIKSMQEQAEEDDGEDDEQ